LVRDHPPASNYAFVVVLYGDTPLVTPATLRRVIHARGRTLGLSKSFLVLPECFQLTNRIISSLAFSMR
jgi:CTP:molybdopterin cytidylyltransferase MocA